MPGAEPAVTVIIVIIVPVISVIVSTIEAIIISIPVWTTVTPIGIVSAVVASPWIPWIIPPAVSIIGTIRVSVGESHSPSRVSPSHTDTPAEGTSCIPVHISVVRIIIVPSVIVIGEPSQSGRVIVIRGVVIVIVNYHSGFLLTIKRIRFCVLCCIQCLAPFRGIGFSQHFCFLLQLVFFIIAQLLIPLGNWLCVGWFLVKGLRAHGFLGCYNSGFWCNSLWGLVLNFARIIINIIIFRGCSRPHGTAGCQNNGGTDDGKW
jgi:hypothetical protein